MYRRLIILSVIILSALCGLSVLGYHAVEKWAQGLRGERRGDFAEVAEQIRQDVNRKLDDFMQTEQDRPYTDYSYYHVPEYVATGQQPQRMPLLRSPLADGLDNNFAWGNFQIESNGSIITSNDEIVQREGATGENKRLYAQVQFNRKNIETNLLPVLNSVTPGSFKIAINYEVNASQKITPDVPEEAKFAKSNVQKGKDVKGGGLEGRQGKALPIESLKTQGQKTQVIKQQRQLFIDNVIANPDLQQRVEDSRRRQLNQWVNLTQAEEMSEEQPQPTQAVHVAKMAEQSAGVQLPPGGQDQSDTVQVRIGGFETIVTGGGNAEESIFGGQVFLVRNVQI